MSKADPVWDTSAHIDGLPCTNWKKRTGVMMVGTLAQCVGRWINLPGHQRQNCTIGWGPCEDRHGNMDAEHIAAYIGRNGLPPALAAARGGQPRPRRHRADRRHRAL